MAGVALRRRRRPGGCSSPPKRLFGFVDDVAPGQADIMQVAIGPLGQFPPLALTIPPDVKGLAELRQKPGAMMIYHQYM
jgi:hypothetical protein